MTISSTVSRTAYEGTGTTGPFAFPFRIFAATDLRLTKVDVDLVQTELSYPADFTADGIGTTSGGTVTLVDALETGETLTIRRVRPVKQLHDIANQGDFYPASYEDALDHATMVAQQQQDGIDRSLKLADTDDPADYDLTLPPLQALKALVVNAAGDGFDMADLSDAQLSAWSATENKTLDVFTGGVDFTAGSSTQLTLSDDPGNEENCTVTRRTTGAVVFLHHDEYTVAGTTLTFGAVIPSGTTQIEVSYLKTFQVNRMLSQNVPWTQLGSGAVARNVRDKLREVFSVLDFGAVGDGVTDDTAAIQQAIDVAESFVPSVNVYAPQAPTVYFPAGKYLTSDSLVIEQPIWLLGAGEQSAQLIAIGADTPAIDISLLEAQSTYIRFGVEGLAIVGNNDDASYTTQDDQDGIRVSGVSDVTVVLHRLRIIGMTGNGVHFADLVNSPVLSDSVIEVCSKAGVRLNGDYVTNSWITRNVIRENRIGIQVKSDSDAYISTGRIHDNLIESNTRGASGAIGSAGRPSVGLWMYRASTFSVRGNYFENQANDLYLEEGVSFCRFADNYWVVSNSFTLPQTYGGPPARQIGVFVDATSTENKFHHNHFVSQPIKPVGVSDANWGTGTFGASYEHATDEQGINEYVDNLTGVPDNGHVLITNPAARHTIISNWRDPDDSTGRAQRYEQLWARREAYQYHEVLDDAHGHHWLKYLGGVPPSYGFQFPDTTSLGYKWHEAITDGTDVVEHGLINPRGREYATWSDSSSARSWYEDWGANAPTSTRKSGEAFDVGDRRWHTDPFEGGPGGGKYVVIGWVCTVAGSPGTWLEMRTLTGN